MTPDDLRALYGPASPRAAAKVIAAFDDHCRAFIEASPFMIMATGDGERLDVSPKGDAPGFVRVQDEGHLLIPDRPGNNRIDGLMNILACPEVALIFLIPGVDETLRVNGTAEILTCPEILASFAIKGRSPVTVTRIAAREIFLHCGKAPLRAGLWRPGTWPEKRPVGTLYDIVQDHAGMAVEDRSQEGVDALYARTLY